MQVMADDDSDYNKQNGWCQSMQFFLQNACYWGPSAGVVVVVVVVVVCNKVR